MGKWEFKDSLGKKFVRPPCQPVKDGHGACVSSEDVSTNKKIMVQTSPATNARSYLKIKAKRTRGMAQVVE
jgi:hypothetical protein